MKEQTWQRVSRATSRHIPVTFDLGSRRTGKNKVTIRCKPSVPGSKFLDFMSKAGGTEDFSGMATAVREVLDTAILEDDHAKFWTFVDRPGERHLDRVAGGDRRVAL